MIHILICYILKYHFNIYHNRISCVWISIKHFLRSLYLICNYPWLSFIVDFFQCIWNQILSWKVVWWLFYEIALIYIIWNLWSRQRSNKLIFYCRWQGCNKIKLAHLAVWLYWKFLNGALIIYCLIPLFRSFIYYFNGPLRYWLCKDTKTSKSTLVVLMTSDDRDYSRYLNKKIYLNSRQYHLSSVKILWKYVCWFQRSVCNKRQKCTQRRLKLVQYYACNLDNNS